MKYLKNKILHLQYLYTKHLIVDSTHQGMLRKQRAINSFKLLQQKKLIILKYSISKTNKS